MATRILNTIKEYTAFNPFITRSESIDKIDYLAVDEILPNMYSSIYLSLGVSM